MPGAGAPDGLLDQLLGDHVELDVVGLAHLGEPVERLLRGGAGAAADDADRLVDDCAGDQRPLEPIGALLGRREQLCVVHRYRGGPGELRTQLDRMLGERVA